MDREDLLEFMRRTPFWVQTTIAATGGPQAAVIGVIVTDALELFFDTLVSSRKCQNLRRDPRMALVMWDDARTIQYEGVGHEVSGDDLARLKPLYFAKFPDGRERETSPDITYVRVRPAWIRSSDFATDPPVIVELTGDELARVVFRRIA